MLIITLIYILIALFVFATAYGGLGKPTKENPIDWEGVIGAGMIAVFWPFMALWMLFNWLSEGR